MRRRAFGFLLVGCWLTGCSSVPARGAKPAPRQVYVVRHAEKVTEPPQENPPLTDAGKVRAAALVDVLPLDSIVAVYSTDTVRTRTTVEPVAKRLGLPVQIYDAFGFDALRDALEPLPPGAVLVAGHSNTIPALLTHFGAVPAPTIPDDRYGDIWVVTLDGADHTTVRTEHFGP